MTQQNIIAFPKNRLKNLISEFNTAYSQMDSATLKLWGRESAKIFLSAGKRRLKNFARGLAHAGKFVFKETLGYTRAYFKRRLSAHFDQRKEVYKSATLQKYAQLKLTLHLIITALKENPREAAPQIFLAFLGFMFGSGGLDGDGGIPDTDLLVGIGHHRSIFTHSIFAAMFIETIAFSFVRLVELFYDKLPLQHDRFWDKIMDNQKRLSQAFIDGACAGIAYHLLVDMNVTAHAIKPYADLPFSASMETHQAIFGGNAVVELVDLDQRNKSDKQS